MTGKFKKFYTKFFEKENKFEGKRTFGMICI
jgi:hypothetical protein